MSLANEMAALADQVVDERKERAEFTAGLRQMNTVRVAEEHNYRRQLREELLAALATSRQARVEAEQQRRRDFREQQQARRQERGARAGAVREELAGFRRGRLLAAQELQRAFGQERAQRVADEQERRAQFGRFHSRLQGEVKEARQETRALLEGYQEARQADAQALDAALQQSREELARQEADRVATFKADYHSLQAEVKSSADATQELLGTYREDRLQARAAWHIVASQPLPIMSPVAEVPEPESTSQPQVATPVETLPPETPWVALEVPAGELPEEELKVRIWEEIKAHPEGVKLTDIEEHLAIARIRAGNVAKSLVDEGKVRKEGLLYFPAEVSPGGGETSPED